ncbi:MAG TPA: ribonuclease Y [Candidatus Sulfotelmatobacter sp.]|nr:ribonuclease Y [Candidatus Sulfotelmatobacter sp.]
MAFAVAAFVYTRRELAAARAAREAEEERLREDRSTAEQERKAIILAAKEEALRLRADAEAEVRERRAEIVRREQRAIQHEESLERRRREVESGEQRLERREAELTDLEHTVEKEKSSISAELERVASLSQQEARGELLARVETELSAEVADRIRQADARVREEADARTREILITAMQRQASDQSGESSITVMQLPSDDLKGRIIGREGRNIRALEAATGVDVIIDDTPEAIIISGFDPVRREVARTTLDRLLADGRIHPARIEEMVTKARSEIGQLIRDEGEQACQELGLTNVHPELIKLLGTLHFRSSYGHNVLAHSKETAAIAGMLAAEIGHDEQEAREIGLFHDIGKAAEHEIEGSHAIIGGEILARLGRPHAVVHAVRAHHYDEEPTTIGAFLLMTADDISASRRGARRETLAASIKRVERLEAIANTFAGVERSFVVQSGKEIRVMVRPHQVDDDQALVLARQIARRLHSEGTYSGRLKVVVLRETRSVEYAK